MDTIQGCRFIRSKTDGCKNFHTGNNSKFLMRHLVLEMVDISISVRSVDHWSAIEYILSPSKL